MTWLQDRNTLRTLAREKRTGLEGTLVYALIAHMRNKLHAKSYRKRAGGWRMAADYDNRYPINTMQDQADWIKWAVRQACLKGDAGYEITQRVLDNAWEELDKKIA